jgi:DNA-binding beta-propeller fold protein YncE
MSLAVASPIRYSHVLGRLSQVADGFNNPVDVALGQQGRLYVLNRTNMNHAPMGFLRVTVLTLDEEFIQQFLTYGTDDGQIVWPTSIATDADERFFVSDEHRHDVQAFDRTGQFLGRFGGLGAGPGQLNRPSGLAVHPDGSVLVADCLNHRVQRFSPDGAHLGTLGEHGSGPGQLNMPWGIAVDRAGNIYVVDWGNDRVQKLDPDGRHLATFGSPGRGEGQLHRPSGVGVDSQGAVYVADYGNDRVQVFEPDGAPLTTLLGEATPSTWGMASISVDQEQVELRAKHFDDVMAQERVFEGPMGIEIDDQDRIFIADCCKHRVQVYQRT